MLCWTIEDKIGYRNLFGKRLVPVSQVDYLVQVDYSVGSRDANKCGTAVASLEMVPSWWNLMDGVIP